MHPLRSTPAPAALTAVGTAEAEAAGTWAGRATGAGLTPINSIVLGPRTET